MTTSETAKVRTTRQADSLVYARSLNVNDRRQPLDGYARLRRSFAAHRTDAKRRRPIASSSADASRSSSL